MSESHSFVRPRLSPDGQRLVVDVLQDDRSDIWVYHFNNGAFERFTNTGGNSPYWTPDGRSLVFRTGPALFWQASDGTGSQESLITPTDATFKTASGLAPGAWSPDGRTFVFVVHTSVANAADIWALTLAGGDRTMKPIVQRPGNQWGVRVSPDGRWISYASDESGRFEVYAEPIGGGAKYQISIDGGEQAVWSPVGDELFYRVDERMMAVAIKAGSTFAADRPHMLFRGRYVSTDLPAYDVTRDGKKFVMVRPGDAELGGGEISAIANWFEELKARVPVQ